MQAGKKCIHKLAIIGGSGLNQLPGLEITAEIHQDTPWGRVLVTAGKYHHHDILFLPRHGAGHKIPPHRINYRANIRALKELQISNIIAVSAVGGITAEMKPRRLVIPDQLIDYTWGRSGTFYEEGLEAVKHIDFTYPYSATLRQQILNAGATANIAIHDGAIYGVVQGPRLETAAEIKRMEKDGCDIVGMTGLPEAALARELEIEYACCALVVNWAAGKTDEIITMETIHNNLKTGMDSIYVLLARLAEGTDK